MANGNRLGCLQMGIAGHNRGSVGFGLVNKAGLQGFDISINLINGITHPKPQISGDLIVARPGGV